MALGTGVVRFAGDRLRAVASLAIDPGALSLVHRPKKASTVAARDFLRRRGASDKPILRSRNAHARQGKDELRQRRSILLGHDLNRPPIPRFPRPGRRLQGHL